MRVSYRWLRELLPDLDVSPEEVASRLTAAGLEVEGVRRFGEGLEPVLVAEVQKLEPHPSRDQLRLVTVGLGSAGTQRLVCGASNVPDPGGLVAVATEGTHLPAVGITLAPRKIGGIESAAMILSETEMGLADFSEGIFILSKGSAEPGSRFVDAIPAAQDTIFEIGITPNRSDALGHVGVARELAALFGLSFSFPKVGEPAATSELELEDLVAVENLELERCPHYGAAVVDGVTVAPSPAWLRFRLWSLGVRPISNVVDVTNLLLLEYGQPLHAFDFELLRGGKVVVRRAKEGEPFTTLDGVARRLSDDDLVICDAEGPTALAGVMGGENTESRSTTRRVLLECAYFTPRGIRRSGRRHALSTESSFRFERGVDWAEVPRVLDRAKVLLTELAGGTAVPGAIHATGPRPVVPTMRLRSSRLNALLGVRVDFADAITTLSRLGFGIERVEDIGDDDGIAEVSGVSFRPDISREVDLVEEVARVRGLDLIPARLPAIMPERAAGALDLERQVARVATDLGLSEAVTYGFVSTRDLDAVRAPRAVITLDNPLTEERSVMRTSLLPGLLEVLRRARRRGERQARLFTVGSCFLPPTKSQESESPARSRMPEDAGILPEERPSFAAVLAGPRLAYLQKTEEVDVYDAKGLAVEALERLSGKTPEVAPAGSRIAHLHPRGAATLALDGVVVGSFGPLHPDVVDALDLDGPAQIVELDLHALERVGRAAPRYRPIPRLPAIDRDVAVVVPEDLDAADVERTLRDAAGDLCESIEIFDVFSGKGIPVGSRSLAFRLIYRDPKATTDPDHARTLTDKEVDACHDRVRASARKLGELRE